MNLSDDLLVEAYKISIKNRDKFKQEFIQILSLELEKRNLKVLVFPK